MRPPPPLLSSALVRGCVLPIPARRTSVTIAPSPRLMRTSPPSPLAQRQNFQRERGPPDGPAVTSVREQNGRRNARRPSSPPGERNGRAAATARSNLARGDPRAGHRPCPTPPRRASAAHITANSAEPKPCQRHHAPLRSAHYERAKRSARGLPAIAARRAWPGAPRVGPRVRAQIFTASCRRQRRQKTQMCSEAQQTRRAGAASGGADGDDGVAAADAAASMERRARAGHGALHWGPWERSIPFRARAQGRARATPWGCWPAAPSLSGPSLRRVRARNVTLLVMYISSKRGRIERTLSCVRRRGGGRHQMQTGGAGASRAAECCTGDYRAARDWRESARCAAYCARTAPGDVPLGRGPSPRTVRARGRRAALTWEHAHWRITRPQRRACAQGSQRQARILPFKKNKKAVFVRILSYYGGAG